MKTKIFLLISLLFLNHLSAAQPPKEWTDAELKKLNEIPSGGDFKPNPEVSAIMIVGHGGRILMSTDDGTTFKQVFFGHPGSDHGMWACSAVNYYNGLFIVKLGWPTMAIIASEDGINWRFLDGGKRAENLKTGKNIGFYQTAVGGNDVIVRSGYMNIDTTSDMGKTWQTFRLSTFNQNAPRPLSTHHVKTFYMGDETGWFLAKGDDRSKGPEKQPCNFFLSKDKGKSWEWIQPKGLEKADPKARVDFVQRKSTLVLLSMSGKDWQTFVSNDAAQTWQGPISTGMMRCSLSEAGGKFWLTDGKKTKVSEDGLSWQDFKGTLPAGKLLITEKGTMISFEAKRYNILRSTDNGKSWKEVFKYEPPKSEYIHGAQGLRAGTIGKINKKPVK